MTLQPTVFTGDCLPILRAFAADQTSAIITDPPYGLADHKPETIIQAITAWGTGDRERVPDGRGFMGNDWDRFVPPPAVWDECYRILKPGAYLAVFGGSRMVDLLGLSIRLAGFEMRDTITWCYGSGFPKSLDISKTIDKAAGVQRETLGLSVRADGTTRDNADTWSNGMGYMGNPGSERVTTTSATKEAQQWEGWGTALKPASEPIILARKPLIGTVAANVLKYGTGGINIDSCRINGRDRTNYGLATATRTHGGVYGVPSPSADFDASQGRWPANMVLSHASTPDGEDACADGCIDGCPVAEMDRQSGDRPSGGSTHDRSVLTTGIYGQYTSGRNDSRPADSGSASRFFPVFRYQAKAPKKERPVINGKAHPTVKPQALIEWLVTLLTPPQGIVIDPFAGSGTLGVAARELGFDSILIENNPEYIPHIYAKLGVTLPTSA